MTTHKKTICVDFDGVLHSYASGWKGADVVADPPVPGAVHWLCNMISVGFDVAIYSSRSEQKGGIEAMRAWLIENGMEECWIKSIRFPTQKPAAFLTIDDRCFRFEGDFPSADWIDRFVPWNKWGERGGI